GPDGLKQDRKGRLYVAGGLNKPNPPFEPATDRKGGIYVFTPEGKLLTFLPVPRDEVTNCAFGGDDFRTLYITGGGTLYSIRTVTEDHRPLQHVVQLADVALPVARPQPLHRNVADPQHLLAQRPGLPRQQVLDQFGDVLAMLAQRRQANRHDVEPVEEILAES